MYNIFVAWHSYDIGATSDQSIPGTRYTWKLVIMLNFWKRKKKKKIAMHGLQAAESNIVTLPLFAK